MALFTEAGAGATSRFCRGGESLSGSLESNRLGCQHATSHSRVVEACQADSVYAKRSQTTVRFEAGSSGEITRYSLTELSRMIGSPTLFTFPRHNDCSNSAFAACPAAHPATVSGCIENDWFRSVCMVHDTCPRDPSSGSTTANQDSSIKKGAPLHADSPIFAVKFINKAYAQKYGRIKAKQLAMETTLHKHVGNHRHIIEYYDSGEDTAWMWIAMELAEGGDLFDKIEADSGVSEDIAHVYFAQLINAVGYMHSKGVGHRDIKPENILLSADGDLKLADFGMATLFEYQGKRKLAVTMCGSPPYIAPEVLSCSSQEGMKGAGYCADLADIWSCGIVLFVLLAGNTPWSRPVQGFDEDGQPNEFSVYVKSQGRPSDDLWGVVPVEALSLLRGMMRVDVESRFSLEDVRRHPWFTRQNKYMDANGKLTSPISLATNLFESLHISFDADPLAGTQKSRQSDVMDIDQPPTSKLGFSSTQPTTPAEDMLFDWEKTSRPFMLSTQPSHGFAQSSTQSALMSNFLMEEPSMSQFAMTPSVTISRTQMAQKFRDILPSQSLTKFFSTWTINLLFPLLLEALGRLGVPTPNTPRPSAMDTQCTIKTRMLDGRACQLSGNIDIELVAEGLLDVTFVKSSGDPLEWRRFFKRVVVLCKDAVYKPEE